MFSLKMCARCRFREICCNWLCCQMVEIVNVLFCQMSFLSKQSQSSWKSWFKAQLNLFQRSGTQQRFSGGSLLSPHWTHLSLTSLFAFWKSCVNLGRVPDKCLIWLVAVVQFIVVWLGSSGDAVNHTGEWGELMNIAAPSVYVQALPARMFLLLQTLFLRVSINVSHPPVSINGHRRWTVHEDLFWTRVCIN